MYQDLYIIDDGNEAYTYLDKCFKKNNCWAR